MAADAWKKYEPFPEAMGDNTIDMDNDTFKMALFLSTSNAATVTNTLYGDLTNEVATAFGYTAGGTTVAATWTHSGGTTTFDVADASWTASGGSLVCRYAVIYDDTAASDPLVCFSLLDNTPANVTVTTGNTLTVQINASGVFTITGMA